MPEKKKRKTEPTEGKKAPTLDMDEESEGEEDEDDSEGSEVEGDDELNEDEYRYQEIEGEKEKEVDSAVEGEGADKVIYFEVRRTDEEIRKKEDNLRALQITKKITSSVREQDTMGASIAKMSDAVLKGMYLLFPASRYQSWRGRKDCLEVN